MRDVVVDEIIYIDEESYQKLKKELGKEDDYYNMKEIIIDNIFDNVLNRKHRQNRLYKQ